jgi:hypothetical protein
MQLAPRNDPLEPILKKGWKGASPFLPAAQAFRPKGHARKGNSNL